MNITKQLEAIREELGKPIPKHLKEIQMAEKKVKPAKKVSKKTVAAAPKKAKGADDNLVSLSEVAGEAKISGQQARQKLRAAGIEREEGKRYGWAPGSKALGEVRKALGL